MRLRASTRTISYVLLIGVAGALVATGLRHDALHQKINDPADEVKLAEAIRLIESIPPAIGGGE